MIHSSNIVFVSGYILFHVFSVLIVKLLVFEKPPLALKEPLNCEQFFVFKNNIVFRFLIRAIITIQFRTR
jgi:hypothetical protein